MFGFYRIGVAVPRTRIGNVDFNTREIKKYWQQAHKEQIAAVAFPELCLTGYSCGDLFFQDSLKAEVAEALKELVEASSSLNTVAIVGCPFTHAGRLYNVAVVIQHGKILGIVPKSFIPNYREFYEKRWFISGKNVHNELASCLGKEIPFGVDLLFALDDKFVFGVEICEDLWSPHAPSAAQAIAGANVHFNISASNENIGKAEFRRNLVLSQSGKCMSAYAYASAGVGESTTDLIFSGHGLIAENAQLLAENERFAWQGNLIFADVDVERLVTLRQQESVMADAHAQTFRKIALKPVKDFSKLQRAIPAHPFIADDVHVRNQRSAEILQMQSVGLARRLEHVQAKVVVLGISGGLDSTLALLACAEAFALLGWERKNILAVTMPGFGTSDQTLKNAKALADAFGTQLSVIDIRPACDQHFKDIEFNPKKLGVVFENVQARERTQVLMDLANKHEGIVVGTGDLSEFALGWATFNGDHMSMYNVNVGVPKTLVQTIVTWYCEHKAEHVSKKLPAVLQAILKTPISPELLPNKDKKGIEHRTEDLVGPYELHDFFLFHFVRYGASPEKILFLAAHAFAGRYSKPEIKKWLTLFLKRFFAQQYKRNTMVDGPKIGTIALSPRGDWRMPSDACADLWLR